MIRDMNLEEINAIAGGIICSNGELGILYPGVPSELLAELRRECGLLNPVEEPPNTVTIIYPKPPYDLEFADPR